MRSIVRAICISRIFYIRDLRSGQFRDLPMLSQWAKFQLPLFRIRTFPFTGNGVGLGPQWWPRRQFSSVTLQRSSEVTLGHQPFFANNFWSKRDRDVRVVSLCFSHQDASIHMQYDLLGSPRDLDLRSNFDLDLSRSYYTCFDAPWRGKHGGVKIIALSFQTQKVSLKNCFAQKCRFWPFVTSDA